MYVLLQIRKWFFFLISTWNHWESHLLVWSMGSWVCWWYPDKGCWGAADWVPGGRKGLDGKKPALTQHWQDGVTLGFGPPDSDDISSLTMDRVAHALDWVCVQFQGPPRFNAPSQGEVAVVAGAGGALHKFVWCTTASFPGPGQSCLWSLMPWSSPVWILQCVPQEAVWRPPKSCSWAKMLILWWVLFPLKSGRLLVFEKHLRPLFSTNVGIG